MKLLIIGGTQFLGRAIVQNAIKKNIEVTIFNRGMSGPGLFPGVNRITGDRNNDIEMLASHWDAVIDTCGYFPSSVAKAVNQLKDRVKQYIFISSVSVYPDLSFSNIDEQTPTAKPESPADLENTEGQTYGIRKRACEEVLEKVFGDRATIIRPGLIVGPYDQTWRFPYWIDRINKGGNVLCPGDPFQKIQFIDVNDLGRWLIHLAQKKTTGVFNAVGPENRPTFEEFVRLSAKTLQSDCTFTWVSEEFLLKHQIAPWIGLPLWVPKGAIGIHSVSNEKAKSAGLTYSPIAKTIKDTQEWITMNNLTPFDGYGISSGCENNLLREWENTQQNNN